MDLHAGAKFQASWDGTPSSTRVIISTDAQYTYYVRGYAPQHSIMKETRHVLRWIRDGGWTPLYPQCVQLPVGV